MATITYIKEARQAVSAMNGVIAYCLQEKKVLDDATGQRMVSGIHCDGKNAFTEFMVTKTAYQKMGGTTFYHYVQSFSPEENTTPQEVHAVAKEFAEQAWPGHEILVATHCDAGHLHSHFVVNSVSFENGRKLRQSPNTLQSLRRLSDEICAAHGLSVLPVYDNSGRGLSAREYRAAVKGESWKFKLMADICDSMNRSGSREEFKREMERHGYQVRWTNERKYITFTCPNGMKCRDNKLHEDKFRKENLEYELQYRETHYGRVSGKKCRRHQQYARLGHAGNGADTGERWDTMVGLLESAVDFQPKVYSLVGERATPEQMADLLNQYLEQEQAISQWLVSQMQEQMTQMEGLAQQAGRNLEKSLNDSLERGSQLEAAIAQAAKRRSWKTWILIIVVSVLASALGAALSALLCIRWLL